MAVHYMEALRATPEGPDADALAARARDWLGQAAERATSLGSPEQALVFVEQALEITPEGLERAHLLEQAARAAGDALRIEQRFAYLEQAVDVLRAAGDVNAEVAMMGLWALALGDLGRVTELRAIVDRMRDRLGEGGDDRARAELALGNALVHFFDEEMGESLQQLDIALAGFEHVQAWEQFLEAIRVRAYVLWRLGRRRESRMLHRGILALAAEEGDLRAMAGVSIALAIVADEPREVVERNLEAAEIARRGGYGPQEMVASANAVESAVDSGDWEQADALLADLHARPELPPDIQGMVTIGDALLAAYRGEAASARALMDGLAEETRRSEDPTLRAWVYRVRSVLAWMEGDLQGACDASNTAIASEPEGPNHPYAVWCGGSAALWMRDAAGAREVLERTPVQEGTWVAATRRAIEAGIAALEGQPGEAAAIFDAVLAGRLAKGDRFTHAVATIDAVAVLPAELVPEGAVETARAYLVELGAVPLLGRLPRANVNAEPARSRH